MRHLFENLEHLISLLAQMNSKEVVTRDAACVAIANLAEQCSDTEIVEKVVRHIFGF